MIEALTLDPAWLFSSLCGVLLYVWRRQENRIAELERQLLSIKELLPRDYVCRRECVERAQKLEKTLDKACDKMDRLAEARRE